MKISIITVCFNSESTIEHAVRSVLSQEKIDLEYIVIDGGSTDQTLPILEKYKSSILHLVSEKDEGIYHALNKGIALAAGEVIGILHSDDFYTSTRALYLVMEKFEKEGPDAVYGDLQYVNKENPDRIFRNWISGPYTEGLFLKGWMPPHPVFFARRDCYIKYGSFNTTFSSSADYELMLRFIHKNKIRLSYIPQVLVKMRVGGKSNETILNRIKANREDRRAWKVNGIKPGLLTLTMKPLSKLLQFIFRT
ncbi:MAG: glycosyltransferase family 2 protein [Bacteroidia bacterium]